MTSDFIPCGATPETVERHEELLEKILAAVEKLDVVTYLNGDDGKTPTTVSREDFNNMLYQRTSAKHKFDSLSNFSNKLIPILVVFTMVISLLTAYVTFHKETKEPAKQELINKQE